MMRISKHAACARWGRASASALDPLISPWIGKGETPVRTAGKDEQASSVTRAGGGGRQRPEKSDRRCFKPRPPLRAEFGGVASLSRRLAGLLSRYLPTDTRPQARANLGTVEITNFSRDATEIVLSARKLS